MERIGLSNFNSRVILRSSLLAPRTPGPYMWKTDASFVLSSKTTKLTDKIDAGTSHRTILVDTNDFSNSEGKLIFDFGTTKQEGPVRYFFKSSDVSLAIDPAYVFQFTHNIGSAVTVVGRKGAVSFDGSGSELPPYITDPSSARDVLQELIKEVKSVGVFLNFIVRYPEQYYATIDVYKSGVDPG